MRIFSALFLILLGAVLGLSCSDSRSTDPGGPDDVEEVYTGIEFAAGNIFCRFSDEFSDNPEQNDEYEAFYWTGIIVVEIRSSTLETNTWIGGWNRSDSTGVRDVGSVRIVLNAERDTVLTVTMQMEYADESQDFSSTMDFSAKNLVQDTDFYQVTGERIIEEHEMTLESVEIRGTRTKTIIDVMENPAAIICLKMY